MILQSPGEIFLHIGPLTIRWYGFLIAIAFLVCLVIGGNIARDRYKSSELSVDELSDFAIMLIVFGLVGARLWFVILNYEYFLEHPSEILQIWLGGQSIQGAIVGAFLGTLAFEYFSASEEKKANFMNLYLRKLSIAAIVVPLGQAIGRWGNFFNEEAYGSITDLPLKLYISHTGLYHHPTFLYESVLNLIIFFILLKISKSLSPVKIIASYLCMYSLIRLVIEQVRVDSLYIGSIKAATLVSLVMLILGSYLFFRDRNKA